MLFAYREAPQESLCFSPLAILRELWTDDASEEVVKTTYEYVIDLRNRLESTCQMAQEELSKALGRYKKYYDSRTRDRKFAVGDRVLVLLPTDSNKLLLQWKGPFKVTHKVGKHDYRVDQNGKIKIYHANMLRKYVERAETTEEERVSASSCLDILNASIIEIDPIDEEFVEGELPPLEQTETVHDVNIGQIESGNQRAQVQELMNEFEDVLTDLPGKTHLSEFCVKLTTADQAYQVPYALRDTVKQEIEAMLRMGVIEKSESTYASPIVLVRKSDGKIRFCIDYRKLNAITIFDPEPIPNIEALLVKISGGKFFTIKVRPS